MWFFLTTTNRPSLLLLIKYVAVFFLFFLINTPLSAQFATPLDNLVQIPDSLQTDSLRIDFLISTSWRTRLKDKPKAFRIARLALLMAKSKGVKELEALGYNLIGLLYMQSSISDSALYYYSLAENAARILKDSGLITSVIINKSIVASGNGDYKQANEYGFQALQLFEHQKDSNGIAFSLKSLGQNFLKMENHEKAIEYLSLAMPTYLKQKRKSSRISIFNAMGVAYHQSGKYDSALHYHQMSLALREEFGDTFGTPGSRMNIGMVFLALKQLQKAKEMFRLAQEGYAEVGDPKGELNSLLNLGEIEMQEKGYKKALSFFTAGYAIAKDLKNPERQSAAAQYVSEAYAKLGAFDKAYQYSVEHKQLADSLFNAGKRKELLDLEAKYQTEKKEKELAGEKLISQAEKEKNNKLVWGFSVLGITTLLVLGLLYIRNRYMQRLKVEQMMLVQQKARFAAVISAEEQERKRIARELHDGLGQLLSTARMNVSSLDDLIENGESEDLTAFETSISLIDEAVKEVRHISHNMMPAALMQAGLIPAIRELIRKINTAGTLTATLETDSLIGRFEESKEIALYRIIQEITNNILRHAEAQSLSIQIQSTGDQVQLDLVDDGKGMSLNAIKQSGGIGWENIQSRVSMLNGNIDIDSSPKTGTHIAIEFPI